MCVLCLASFVVLCDNNVVVVPCCFSCHVTIIVLLNINTNCFFFFFWERGMVQRMMLFQKTYFLKFLKKGFYFFFKILNWSVYINSLSAIWFWVLRAHRKKNQLNMQKVLLHSSLWERFCCVLVLQKERNKCSRVMYNAHD